MEVSIYRINNHVKKKDNDDLENIINAFRYLRNACGKDPDCQRAITEKNIDVVNNTRDILMEFVLNEKLNENKILCIVVGLQFLANLLVNNNENKKTIWLRCQDLFDKCLVFDNGKVQHCCLMILYNIFLGNDEILNSISKPFECVIHLTTKEDSSEYALFLTDLFINNKNYLQNFYEKLNSESKLIILEEAERLINDCATDACVSFDTLKFFINLFSQKADTILNKVKEQTEYFNVVEVIKLLNVLLASSSDDGKKYLQFLQKETSFFIDCITVLKAVHMLSKEKNNYFTAETKMSEFAEPDENVMNNPALGFKSSLVRIIGNLCWKNKKFQDIVRDFECVQVILDSCVIDRKNPFITQWSIFAIHNICENNCENQKIIAQLSKEGVIDVKSLNELGIALNQNDSDDNTLYLAPLNITKTH